MAVTLYVLAVVTFLHVLAFLLAVGAEQRRTIATVVTDVDDKRKYCIYGPDPATVYGTVAMGLLLISQTVVNGVTRCLCFGKGLVSGKSSTTCAIFFFIVSWVSFLGAEACLLGGSVRTAYHTKYKGVVGGEKLSCATLRKGVFAAGAAFTLLSLAGSVFYYWAHTKADTGGWEKHKSEGVGMTASGIEKNQNAESANV